MNEISSIKYVDAYYSYEKDIGETKLSVFEAYGYVEEKADNIVIIFIKKRGLNSNESSGEEGNIIKGLVIPDKALVSVVDKYHTDILDNISEGSIVEVVWRDVVYVANQPRRDCSVMRTKGGVFKIKKDHVVLKNPETTRTYPNPVKNHPEEGNPSYLVIPLSFITSIELIHT